MADPSYLQSVTLSQETQLKEYLLHLYLYQDGQAQPNGNQAQLLGSTRPHGFGCTIVNDWSIHDGSSPTTNIVARAQGLHLQASMSGGGNWFVCHNIVFIDDRFKGSTLKVLGNMEAQEGEWAIIGGTGEFAYAQGVVTYKPSSTGTAVVTRELHIRVLCLTFLKPAAPAVPTSTGQATAPHADAADVQAPDVPPVAVPEVDVSAPVVPSSEMQGVPEVPAPDQVLAPVVPGPTVPMTLTKIGPWGHLTGDYFDMQKDLPQRLLRVFVSSANVISLIQTHYLNKAGDERWAQCGGRPVPGSKNEQMTLQPGEFLKNVSGTTRQNYDGNVGISSLTFVTNLRTYGPFGSEGSHSSFRSPNLEDNNSIVGFFGQHTSFGFRSDGSNYINSLGVYVLHPV